MNGTYKKNIVLCDSTREKRGRLGTFTSLNPVLMRKVRIFEFLCPNKHSKIRIGSMRKPPVSLLSLKNFFHAEVLFEGHFCEATSK